MTDRPDDLTPTASDLGRILLSDMEHALTWRGIAYDLPAYRADSTKLAHWVEGWPTAIRGARTRTGRI